MEMNSDYFCCCCCFFSLEFTLEKHAPTATKPLDLMHFNNNNFYVDGLQMIIHEFLFFYTKKFQAEKFQKGRKPKTTRNVAEKKSILATQNTGLHNFQLKFVEFFN